MSADIPNNMLLTDLLKSAEYNCPENLEERNKSIQETLL